MAAELRWGGDFSLPRFRAKLANKYLMHPDVEPSYEEVYRPELGERTIVRKGLGGFGGSRSMTDLRGVRSSDMERTLLRPATPTSMRTRTPASLFEGGGRESRLSFSSSTGGLLRGSSSSSSLPQLREAAPAPSLGVCRMEVPPASLQRRPSAAGSLGGTVMKTLVSPMLASPPPHADAASPPTSPASADDKKEAEKDKNMEVQSRKMWSSAHGSEFELKMALTMPADEKAGGPGNLAKIQLGGLQRALKNGAKLDWRNNEWDGATLMMKAVRTGSTEFAQYLLAIGADPSVTDYSGRNALHWASHEGALLIVKDILEKVPTLLPSVPDNGGDAPMHFAAYNGHLPVLRLLLHAKADPDQPNGGGFTPMELASARRMWHVTEFLANMRPTVEIQGSLRQQLQERSVEEEPEEGGPELRDLLRACNQARANEIQAFYDECPAARPKKGKAPGPPPKK